MRKSVNFNSFRLRIYSYYSRTVRLLFVFSPFFYYLFIYLFNLFIRMNRILILLVTTLMGFASAQVPGFGWCPEYSPMADFDLNRYTGVWYEAERYFTVLEAGSRCVRSNYTRGLDGKFRVSNEITNRLTGIRRVLDGVVQNIGKGGEGKISVKYNTLPVPIDTQYSVLDTDYDTYSVVWSCSSLGPINTQNAWVMTRERLAPGTVLQQAYGVLDKYKISRTFFVKTDQSDCMFTDPAAIPPDANQFKTEETPVQVQQPVQTFEVAQGQGQQTQQYTFHTVEVPQVPQQQQAQQQTFQTVQIAQAPQRVQTVQTQSASQQSPVKTESVIVREPVKIVTEQGKPVPVESFVIQQQQVPAQQVQQVRVQQVPNTVQVQQQPIVKEEAVKKVHVPETIIKQTVHN